MKNTLGILILLIIFISACVSEMPKIDEPKNKNIFVENGISYIAKTENRSFYVYKDGIWEKKFLKGVSIGAAKPGTWPGELAITKEDYYRWFSYIKDMNVDVIRVYTTLKPDFYDAL